MNRQGTKERATKGRSAWQSGLWAEDLAALWLQLKGYRILERRLKTPGGEIDILARRGSVVAVVEVKQRRERAQAAAAISARQQQRLENAVRFVLARRPELSHHDIRFDAVLVSSWGWLQHLPNAWTGS